LLDVSRIGSGKILLRRQPLDLCSLARVTAEDHRAGIEAAGLKLNVELPSAAVWIKGDHTRLAQVIGNLLHNASKFTDAGGTICLHLSVTDGCAVLIVSDTGI